MIRWFSPAKHYDPYDYELWFENLALQGYHPHITPFSFIAMRFHKGTPKKYKYVVDVQSMPKKKYYETYENFGWERVGKMSNMFVWRKEYTDEKPAAFSDRESLFKRNARIANAITFSTVQVFVTSILCWTGFVFTLGNKDIGVTIALGILGGLTFFAGIGLLILSIRILRSKKAMKPK